MRDEDRYGEQLPLFHCPYCIPVDDHIKKGEE